MPSESFEITRSVVEDIMSTANTASTRNRIKRHRVTGIWIGIMRFMVSGTTWEP